MRHLLAVIGIGGLAACQVPEGLQSQRVSSACPTGYERAPNGSCTAQDQNEQAGRSTTVMRGTYSDQVLIPNDLCPANENNVCEDSERLYD